MFHSPSLGSVPRRHRLVSLLLALALAGGAVFSFGGMAYAARQVPAKAASPDTTNSAVTFANAHWRDTYYTTSSTFQFYCDSAGYYYNNKTGLYQCYDTNHYAAQVPNDGGTYAQPYYECAEFVARALAYEGFIPGLKSTSSQAAFGSYKPGNGKTYDLLLITPESGYNTLADFLLTFGYVVNIHDNLGNEEPGDMVVFDVGGVPQHIALITSIGSRTKSSTKIDAHNNAHYDLPLSDEITGFDTWYILHVVPGQS
ncbi:MAG: hypothetical protein ACLQUY_24465 [Ktedonobacterales bacterium]